MVSLIRRGILLLRANPGLFARRLLAVIRHPVAGARALEAIARSYRAVEASYAEWWREEGPTAAVAERPLLSVLMPVYNVEPRYLIAAIESVLGQRHAAWELCIADDASADPAVQETLGRYAAVDARVRVEYREKSGHIAAASNSALALAHGEFVVLLDHDDVFHPDALAEVAAVIRENRQVDLIYSDEDKLDREDRHTAPFFKPAWSPSLLMSCNYITHLAALRRTLVLEVGGFRDETIGSQDHDLFLRVSERARAIAHIPRVLYSWRIAPGSTAAASSAKPYAVEAARRALEDAVRRRGPPAEVTPSQLNGIFLLRETGDEREADSVSIVLTGTGDAWQQILAVARDCRGELHTPAPRFQRAFLATERGRMQFAPTVITSATRLSMEAVTPDAGDPAALTGDYLLFLDAGSAPVDHSSVAALIEALHLSGAPIAGGMTVVGGEVGQAGLVIDEGGQPQYAFAGLKTLPYRSFYLNLKDLPREVSAIWVGCAAMRRDEYVRLGGLDPSLPPALAMVDLCLRAWEAGQSVIYSPQARFRRRQPLPALPRVQDHAWRWQAYADPFSNPNLTPSHPDGLPFQHGVRRPRIRDAASKVVRR